MLFLLLRGFRPLVLLAVTDSETGVPLAVPDCCSSLLRGFRPLVLLAVTDCEVPYAVSDGRPSSSSRLLFLSPTRFQTASPSRSYRQRGTLRRFRRAFPLAVPDCYSSLLRVQTASPSRSYRLRGTLRRFRRAFSSSSSRLLFLSPTRFQTASPSRSYRLRGSCCRQLASLPRLQTLRSSYSLHPVPLDSRFRPRRHSQLQIAYPTPKDESFSRQKATRRQNRRRHGYSDFSLTSLPRPNYDRV
ncbi:hypothetical protein LSTR_LSTR013856 [Laodelphax striatellus]|uniref:Secreted protein n=1 Tax=Laodelphax striatellus TaxID=195883 RepID=A0A482XHC0_LAOST|nr:hypothetical protein LSTR_LSTR013856 [Laodelphax striatellus]